MLTNSTTLSQNNVAADVLNKTIEIFTAHSEKSFEDVMANGLSPIADAVGLDRIDIYHKIEEDNDDLSPFYRWYKPIGGTAPINGLLRVLPHNSAVTKWLKILLKGEYVTLRLDKMSEDEAEFANSVDIKSIVVMPVFMQDKLWGIVAFQDLEKERDFDEHIALLHSVACLCANAAIREDMRKKNEDNIKALKQREKMLSELNKTAITFISQNEESFEKKMTEGLKYICDMIDLDRLSIFRNYRKTDGMHSSQIYRWSKAEGGTTDPLDSLKDITFSEMAPRWEKILEDDEITNGPARLMPEAAMLKSFGVISVLVVPIFIKNKLWGFGFFEDIRRERYFDELQVEILRSTAFLCANIVIRTELEEDIEEEINFNDTLINAAPISITICDENANMLDCNSTASRMFGCAKDYFIEHFYDLSPELQPDGMNSKEKVRLILKNVKEKERIKFEWIHRSYSGELIPCEISLEKMINKGKTIIIIYIYDLRSIKNMENVANEALEKARAIAEASPVSYVLFNENLQIEDCNETAVQILKSPSKQYLLDNYWITFATDEQPDGQNSYDKSRVVLNKALAEGKHSFEWIQKTFDGEEVPMENTLYPLIFKDKKFIISFKYDLRKYKSMMDSIREQSELLLMRLEQQKQVSEISKSFISSGNPITLIDEAISRVGKNLNASRILIISMDYEALDVEPTYQWYADDNVPRMTTNRNFSLFDIIRKTFPAQLPEDITAIPTVSCADVNNGPEVFRVFSSVNTLSFICVPLYVDDKLWGIIDIEKCYEPHEWSEDEVVFFSMISSLISGVIMRNTYDTKLKDSLNKVIELSKAKDEFLSKMSHEIRTPMNAILGITEILLQDELLPQGIRDNLNIIYNSGDSLLRIINDLLDFSKIEAKKLEILPAKYEIASLVNDAAQLNMMRIENKAIEFKINVDANIPSEFFGDELRIKQILNNILSNAFKYTHSGKVCLDVAVEKNAENQEEVVLIFRVSDTGQGMTKEQVANLFSSEYIRFNMGANRSIEGTGLGMSITQNLVKLMNGEISVDSTPGEGSVFTVRLPQKTIGADILGKEMADNLQKFRIGSTTQMKKMHIIREPMPYGSVLIVDDVESNLYVAKRLLTPYDLTIDTASSGFEAIDKVKSGAIYDIIFMDHMMPQMDGMETTAKIRELGYNSPIIALTANAIAGQSEIFLKNGFDAFISKPIDTIQLNSELNRFIRDKQTPEVIEEARKQKSQDMKYKRVTEKADIALYSIFIRDAQKALPILENTLSQIDSISNENLHPFVIQVHAMKSAFANIGEITLSQLALNLEKAGKEHDKNIIKTKTPELVTALKRIVTETNVEKEKISVDKDENPAYLREQLKAVSEACTNYDQKAATTALENLSKMSWTKNTKERLDKIAENILHSDFEEASKLANQ